VLCGARREGVCATPALRAGHSSALPLSNWNVRGSPLHNPMARVRACTGHPFDRPWPAHGQPRAPTGRRHGPARCRGAGPRRCLPSNMRPHGRARRRRQGAQSAPWPRLSLSRTSCGMFFLGRGRAGGGASEAPRGHRGAGGQDQGAGACRCSPREPLGGLGCQCGRRVDWPVYRGKHHPLK